MGHFASGAKYCPCVHIVTLIVHFVADWNMISSIEMHAVAVRCKGVITWRHQRLKVSLTNFEVDHRKKLDVEWQSIKHAIFCHS